MLTAEIIEQSLLGLRLGRPLYFYTTLGSTNTQAKILAAAGAPEGTLVIAEEQTAGRGRGRRIWLTPAGVALAFSLILRPAGLAEPPRLVMLAGVAVCEAVEQIAGVRADLKWPNDVLLAGKKTGGILVETALSGERPDYAVLGVGLNVSWAPPAAATDFPATSLQAEAGRTIDRPQLLRAVLERLEIYYPRLNDADLFAEWQRRQAFIGRSILLKSGDDVWEGMAVGVTPEGALQVRLESGRLICATAGDVCLRPASRQHSLPI